MVYDVVIIGAGVIGSATAYHLKKLSPKMNILLIDKNSHTAAGNTSKSAALYRNLFSSRTSQILASNSIEFYKNIAHHISLKEIGYLWTFSQDQWNNVSKIIQDMDKSKFNYTIQDQSEIGKDFLIDVGTKEQNLNKKRIFSPIHKGILGTSCGSLSAVGLSRYYVSRYQDLGGEVKLNSQVIQTIMSNSDIHYAPWTSISLTHLRLKSGKKISADKFIFATGAWTQELLGPMGIASHIYPKKRQLFTLEIENSNDLFLNFDESHPAMIIPSGGVYIKTTPNPRKIIVGCANHLGNPFERSQNPPQATEEYFHAVIEPVLHYYFPNLTKYQIIGKWAGYYAYYWPDGNPVIEKIANIEWVSGTSGSGIMKADSIGRIAAAKLLGHDNAILYSGDQFVVDNLSLRNRKVDIEKLII